MRRRIHVRRSHMNPTINKDLFYQILYVNDHKYLHLELLKTMCV